MKEIPVFELDKTWDSRNWLKVIAMKELLADQKCEYMKAEELGARVLVSFRTPKKDTKCLYFDKLTKANIRQKMKEEKQ